MTGIQEFDYNYNNLGKLFLGECAMIEGFNFCPPNQPVYTYAIKPSDMGPDCAVFDDVVFCEHDMVEALNGGNCMLVGFTYICKEDFPVILKS